MQVHKPFKLIVPTYIYNRINNEISRNKNAYYFIIDYMINYTNQDKRNKDGYININCNEMQAVIKRKPYSYIKTLEKCELLECNNVYKIGVHKQMYRINPSIILDFNTVDVHSTDTLFKPLLKYYRNKKTHYNLLEPYLAEMKNKLMNIEFDYNAAFKWIDSVADDKKRISYYSAVLRLQDNRQRYFKRNKTNNRLDTNLTNLKKDLRNFLIGDFVQIDLKNSQPLLLSILIKQLLNTNTILMFQKIKKNIIQNIGIKSFNTLSKIRKNQDFSKNANYCLYDWTISGQFYERMEKEFNYKFCRNEIKELMFKVLFSKNLCRNEKAVFEPYKKEKELFAKIFPYEYEVIKLLKEKNHEYLSILLQKIESNIFIDTIAPRLVENGIIPLTIHDSVIVEVEHKEKALNIIHNSFVEVVGIVPSFSIEKLNITNIKST